MLNADVQSANIGIHSAWRKVSSGDGLLTEQYSTDSAHVCQLNLMLALTCALCC